MTRPPKFSVESVMQAIEDCTSQTGEPPKVYKIQQALGGGNGKRIKEILDEFHKSRTEAELEKTNTRSFQEILEKEGSMEADMIAACRNFMAEISAISQRACAAVEEKAR